MLAGALQEITRNDEVLIGTSNVIITPTRHTEPRRRVLVVRNTSANDADIISISYGQFPAENGKGIVLRKNESFTESDGDDYPCYQDQVNAICATANGKLAVFER